MMNDCTPILPSVAAQAFANAHERTNPLDVWEIDTLQSLWVTYEDTSVWESKGWIEVSFYKGGVNSQFINSCELNKTSRARLKWALKEILKRAGYSGHKGKLELAATGLKQIDLSRFKLDSVAYKVVGNITCPA